MRQLGFRTTFEGISFAFFFYSCLFRRLPTMLLLLRCDVSSTYTNIVVIDIFARCASLKQTKRVPVQIRYSANSGLRPYFLTVARRLKTDYPDVLIERTLLSKSDSGGGGTSGGSSGGSTDSESGLFEVVIDGRAVVRLNAGRRGVTGTDGGMTIFVSMEEVDQAIGRARRRRRPSTVYGEDNETNVRLEVLKNKAAESLNSKQ